MHVGRNNIKMLVGSFVYIYALQPYKGTSGEYCNGAVGLSFIHTRNWYKSTCTLDTFPCARFLLHKFLIAPNRTQLYSILSSVLSAGSPTSSLSEFQAAEPGIAKARRSYVLKACPHRQQSFRFWQQFVAENGSKVASVDRP